MVQTNEDVFKVIFKNLRSENLIRELCLALKGQLYLPNDSIINKGDIASDVYFIVDGTVHMMEADLQTIAMTLGAGNYFGEVEVLSESRRLFHVKAATFCTINSLSCDDLNQIAHVYP
jgi:CRP-like cAMP-binding protein